MWWLVFLLCCGLTSCQRSPVWVAEDPSVRALHEKSAGNAGILVKTAWIDAPATDRARARFVFTNTSDRSLFLEYAGHRRPLTMAGSEMVPGRTTLAQLEGRRGHPSQQYWRARVKNSRHGD
jgi:hypothetical protein